MYPSKAVRNTQIVALAASGVGYEELAKRFDMTRAAVGQVLWRAKQQREENAQPTYRPGARPRIKKASTGLWECSDGVVERAAKTPGEAYTRWLTAAILEAQETAVA